MSTIFAIVLVICLKHANAAATGATGEGMLQLFIRHMGRTVAVDFDSTATVGDIREAARIHFEALKEFAFALVHDGSTLNDNDSCELLSDLGIGPEHVIGIAVSAVLNCGCKRTKADYQHQCTSMCKSIECNKACGFPGTRKVRREKRPVHRRLHPEQDTELAAKAAKTFPRATAPLTPEVAPEIENDTIRNTKDLDAHFNAGEIEQIVEYAEKIEGDLCKDICFLIAGEGSQDYNYVSRDKRGCYQYYKDIGLWDTRYRFVGYYNLKK